MMSDSMYVPVMLKCDGRLCLLVGGGAVAERKAAALLDAGASVHIVSPQLKSGQLRRLADEGAVRWTSRAYEPGDLQGAFLVYAATNDDALNKTIALEADRLGIWVNVASDGEAGSFISPAVMRRGRLTLAVATSGAGPAAAVRIRQQLEEQFGREYEEYLDILYSMRSAIKAQVESAETRKRLLDRLYRLDILGDIRRGGYESWNTEKIKLWIENNQEE